MARSKRITAELAKLLDLAVQPIYVLDDEQAIVFCNQACLDWVGRTEDELHGRRCTYHSSPDVDPIDAAAAGLCPSPQVLTGEETVSSIVSLACQDQPRCRRARFIPVGTGDDVVGIVAFVDSEDVDLSNSVSPRAGESEATGLHERIRAFRHKAAGLCGLGRLVGDSPAMRRARAQIALAAGSRASVLIVGPSGSGRQHVAGTIHHADDSHQAGSLIPLACSLLGAELIHSTIDAMASRKPYSQQSTLLLNDADQLPAEVQAEMVNTLGGKSFPLRVIATSRRSLIEMSREGEYREDLAWLLSTVVIELPPLASRRGDVPLLAQLFLEEANVRGIKQVLGFSAEAMDYLDAYSWPGNVDELIQIVAQAYKRAGGHQIEVGDLPERIHLAADAAAHPPPTEETIVMDEFLEKIERELIKRAMDRAKGNKTKAAKLLGMTRPRLYRRLVQLGLAD